MKPDYRNKALAIFTAWLFVFIFARTGLAAKPTPSNEKGQPSIQVSEPNFDFGEVQEGTDIEHDFTVRNTGTGILNIEKVRVS